MDAEGRRDAKGGELRKLLLKSLKECEMRDGRVCSYAGRNKVLKEIGFANYADYLASSLWVDVRAAAFERHGSRCVLCGGDAGYIHHNSYDKGTLLGSNLEHMAPVCRGCHEQVEFKNGKKRTMYQAVAKFLGMLGKHQRRLLFNNKNRRSRKKLGKYRSKGKKKPKKSWCSVCGRAAKRGWTMCRLCIAKDVASDPPPQSVPTTFVERMKALGIRSRTSP
jgi:hypothetical protein